MLRSLHKRYEESSDLSADALRSSASPLIQIFVIGLCSLLLQVCVSLLVDLHTSISALATFAIVQEAAIWRIGRSQRHALLFVTFKNAQ